MKKQLSLLFILVVTSINVCASLTPEDKDYLRSEFKKVKTPLSCRILKTSAIAGAGVYAGMVLAYTFPETVHPFIKQSIEHFTRLKETAQSLFGTYQVPESPLSKEAEEMSEARRVSKSEETNPETTENNG